MTVMHETLPHRTFGPVLVRSAEMRTSAQRHHRLVRAQFRFAVLAGSCVGSAVAILATMPL